MGWLDVWLREMVLVQQNWKDGDSVINQNRNVFLEKCKSRWGFSVIFSI